MAEAFRPPADIRDPDALRAVVDKGIEAFGRLDIIVANAGICIPAPWNEITIQSFRDVIDINVTGTWKHGDGRGHNTSSTVDAVDRSSLSARMPG